MARLLPTTYTDALAATTRRPNAQVFVYYSDPETELEITDHVVSVAVTTTEEHRAGSATLDIANPQGLFDPIGGREYAGALAEDTRVVVKMGYSGSVHVCFTGRIASARMRYQRGQAEQIEVTCLDMGKRFWQQQITTTLYENTQANAIVTDLFTTYGGMDAGDISLAALTYLIERVQFVEENLFDAGLMAVMGKGYRLFFDYDGILKSKSAVAPDSSSWDYESGKFVEWLEYDWSDPTTNKVLVYGRTLNPEESPGGPETKWVSCENYTTRPQKHITTWYVPFPSGHYYSANRVDLTYNPWSMITSIYISKADRDGVWVTAEHRSAPLGSTIDFDVYGVETTISTPVVTGSAQDDALIAKYGEIIEQIENPLVQTTEDANALATEVLRVAKWYRYKPRLRVPCNLVHEPGDRITVHNPRTGQTHALYIREISHRHARGSEASTELQCLLIT